MNPAHARLAATAKRLIEKNGRAMQIVRTETQPGPDSDFDPGSSTTVTTVTDVVGVQSKVEQSEADGQRIRVDDRAYLFPPETPVDGDSFVRDNGRDYPIAVTQDVKPGSTIMLRKIWCRSS